MRRPMQGRLMTSPTPLGNYVQITFSDCSPACLGPLHTILRLCTQSAILLLFPLSLSLSLSSLSVSLYLPPSPSLSLPLPPSPSLSLPLPPSPSLSLPLPPSPSLPPLSLSLSLSLSISISFDRCFFLDRFPCFYIGTYLRIALSSSPLKMFQHSVAVFFILS